MACTVPPKGTAPVANTDATTTLNSWIRRYALAHHMTLVDLYPALVNPATGAFLTAYDSGDGVHPNERGAKLIGEMIAAAIIKDMVGSVSADIAQVGVGVSNLLYTNPLFLTKQGNGIPTGFVALLSFSTTVHDRVDVVGIPGKVFKITRGDSSTNIATGNVLHFAGRRYRLAYRIRRTATDTYQQYNPKIEAVDGTFIACAVTTWPSTEFITVVHEYVLPTGLAT